jgi:hypothetical protein
VLKDVGHMGMLEATDLVNQFFKKMLLGYEEAL